MGATKAAACNPIYVLLAASLLVSFIYNWQTANLQKKVKKAQDRGEPYPGYFDRPMQRQISFDLGRIDDDDNDDDDGKEMHLTNLRGDDTKIDNFLDDINDDDDDDNDDNNDDDNDDDDNGDNNDDNDDNDDDDNDDDTDDGDDNDGDDNDDTNNDGDDNDKVATDTKVTVKTTNAVDDHKPSPTTKAPPSITKPGTDTSIREWGCDLTETPLIFVHNGKSGGGSIRARLAAGARDYDRKNAWAKTQGDNHFYPVLGDDHEIYKNANNTERRGKFCNSLYPHYTGTPHIDVPLTSKNYEGEAPCNATTPLGIAVACPHPYKKNSGSSSGRPGGIRLDHYQSSTCQRCDDDYYLEMDYYFPNTDSNGDQQRRRLKREKRRKANQTTDKKPVQKKSNQPPPPLPETVFDPSHDPPPESTCDIVFTAHNNVGAELNYLPPRYIKEHWWDNSEYASEKSKSNSKSLKKYWDVLLSDRQRRREKLIRRSKGVEAPNDGDSDTGNRWCPNGYTIPGSNITLYDRPSTPLEYRHAYGSCGVPLAAQADRAFEEAFFAGAKTKNYSPFYASMPLHRVTVMRDPWSWVISKFFWHHIERRVPEKEGVLPCFDVTYPINARGDGEKRTPNDPITGRPLGWCEQFALTFMIKLCGNDCRVRYENGMMTLEELEEQTASNLRNAFSVVGLLQEEHSFYDMVADRIGYVDLTRNLHVHGASHATAKTDANLGCKALFGTNETFRESVRRDVPAFAALERIYHLGVEVNAFQKEELRQCKLAKGQQPTVGNYTRPS